MGEDGLVVLREDGRSLGRAPARAGEAEMHSPPTGPALWYPRVAGPVLCSQIGAATALPTGKGESSRVDMSNPQTQP